MRVQDRGSHGCSSLAIVVTLVAGTLMLSITLQVRLRQLDEQIPAHAPMT
jgi:hypothetical protein